jgi:hypothetical protein
MHRVAENEKENQWKEVIEEQDRAIAQRELQVDASESEKGFHFECSVVARTDVVATPLCRRKHTRLLAGVSRRQSAVATTPVLIREASFQSVR